MSGSESNKMTNFPALDLPDDRSQWAGWLELQLVGLALGKIVRQLVLLGANRKPEISLREWLGESKRTILTQGLSSISEQQLQVLIRNPSLLIQLQEMVLLEGGEFWEKIPRTEEHLELAKESESKFLASLQVGTPDDLRENPTGQTENTNELNKVRTSTKQSKNNIALWATLAAVAAGLAIVFFNPMPARQPKAFFAAAQLQKVGVEANQTLQQMALQIRNDWQKNSTDRGDLQEQLLAFRDSCEQLIDGPLATTLRTNGLHPDQLADVQKRCKDWKAKSTALIESLAAGDPLSPIVQAADEMIGKLIGRLETIAGA
jgi:hypothetical protein